MIGFLMLHVAIIDVAVEKGALPLLGCPTTLVLQVFHLNNYYARVIIIECKNKRFAANIIGFICQGPKGRDK